MALLLLLPRACQGFAWVSSPSRRLLLSSPTMIRRAAPITRRHSSTSTYDEEQVRLFEEERIVSVTFDDKPIKAILKKSGHATKKGPPLHRAFSVFLFDTQGRLLLQKRAAAKITFPSTWTNTCCSHPLWNEAEMGDDVQDPVLGCKRAAIRKLEHELGIPAVSLAPDDFTYMTRIHYICDSDPEWGEHEIDYIFLCRKDVALTPNPNEVSEVRYVDQAELKAMFRTAELHRGASQETLLAEEEDGVKFTPWSRVIIERWLSAWWADVGEDKKKLDKWCDTRIHRCGRVEP